MTCQVALSSTRHDDDSLLIPTAAAGQELLPVGFRLHTPQGANGRSLSEKTALTSFGQGDSRGWKAADGF